MNYSFPSHLKLYGPQNRQPVPMSLDASRRYCRALACKHYENFTVASWLLPRRMRQHFANVYAYCRWADDISDETADPQHSIRLLNWWESQLKECYQGEAIHPVFVALSETIERFEIPPDPFIDLLRAFRQDQCKTRYDTADELLDYCCYSANPVGRLVLYLGQCGDKIRVQLSDSICTGLQLANFWQDVANDWERGRIYIPQDHCDRFGYDESMFARHEFNDEFRQMLGAEVDNAECFLRRGLPLVDLVPRWLKLDIALFVHGGLAILDAVRRQNYDVWSKRPTVSSTQKFRLFVGCWWKLRHGSLGIAL